MSLSVKKRKREEEEEEDDPILVEKRSRFVLFPIQYFSLWSLYKKAEASFWTVSEIPLNEDAKQFTTDLTDDERFFVKKVLAYFASSDGIVNENLALRFFKDVVIPEARSFYGFQIMMENIHAEAYSLLIDTLVVDGQEKQGLFNAIEEDPAVKIKAEWAIKWIQEEERSFAERLLAFACVEGIFFSSSFCAIFWLKKRGKMPGLTFSNELISRDEGLHLEFAVTLFLLLKEKPSSEAMTEIVTSAVEAETQFVRSALPVEMLGMNSELMIQYVRYVGDRLLKSVGQEPFYKVTNPFDFMELISLEGKTNFFERRVGEYQKAGVINQLHSSSSKLKMSTNGDVLHASNTSLSFDEDC